MIALRLIGGFIFSYHGVMGLFYRSFVRPLLFKFEEEKAHDLGIAAMETLAAVTPVRKLMESYNGVNGAKPIELFGLKFPNSIGMAAGLDKNGRCWSACAALGFGHVEIGTVTAQKQAGNDRPRLFRYPRHQAIINRMGFNNDGAEAVATRLKASTRKYSKRKIPLGINIGMTRTCPLDRAAEDYLFSFHELAPYADYFTVNVSSPNTPGLRKLQDRDHLPALLRALNDANNSRAKKLGTTPIPLLLKIAPDLSFPDIDSILETVFAEKISGVIATNTTLWRPSAHSTELKESGGLSGVPIFQRSRNVVNYISRATDGRLPIIACGGVHDATTAGKMIDAGASLIQVYTAFIYEGPFLPKDLARSLSWRNADWA